MITLLSFLVGILTVHANIAQVASNQPQVGITAPVENDAPLSLLDTLADKYGINPVLAQKIISCESNNDPNAVHKNSNGTYDYGLFQVNDRSWSWLFKEKNWDITNPDDSLQAGFWILSNSGLQNWDASKSCWNK